MSGPLADPLKPHSRHRSRDAGRGVVVLPFECTLPAPKIPSARKWTAAERRTWRELWSSPQASQWDDSFVPAVAAFLVHAHAVLSGTASAWQAQEQRHLGHELGLTPQGMQALGWVLPDPAPAAVAVVVPLRGA